MVLLQLAETYSLDQQFMFGPSLLVAPVMEQGASSKEVYLPAGSRWFDAHNGQEVKPSTGWLGTGQQSLHQVCPIAVTAGMLFHSLFMSRALEVRDTRQICKGEYPTTCVLCCLYCWAD